MPLEVFGQEKVERPSFSGKERKKAKFVDLSATATIRILTEERVVIDTHYINRATVKCLGDNCPVCKNNKNLIMQYPDTFREESHYSPKRQLKLVNVYDKTAVRICSKCSAEQLSPTCRNCGEIITAMPSPSNSIKILSKGVQLFDSLDVISNAVLDASGEKIGITNFDLTLLVSGTGTSRTVTPLVGPTSPLPEFNKEDLFDLENVTIELSPSEMLDLQRGISLRDIFAARKASSAKTPFDSTPLSKESLDSVQEDVDALFK